MSCSAQGWALPESAAQRAWRIGCLHAHAVRTGAWPDGLAPALLAHYLRSELPTEEAAMLGDAVRHALCSDVALWRVCVHAAVERASLARPGPPPAPPASESAVDGASPVRRTRRPVVHRRPPRGLGSAARRRPT